MTTNGPYIKRQPEVERAFATAITVLRKKKGWSRAAMAEHLTNKHRQFSPQMLGHLENGIQRITLSDAIAIAAVFNCRPDDLIAQGHHKRAQLADAAGRWPK